MKEALSEACSTFFAVLANPTRLAIVDLLRDGSKSVLEIAESLKAEQSMISHNLKSLEGCRFVFSKKSGKQRFYSLNLETMEPLMETFNFHAKKYCPEKGKCLTTKGIKEQRKKEASNKLYVNHE